MQLAYAHTADFIAVDTSGKLTIVGGFDIIWDHARVRPILFPPFFLVAAFEASVAEGAEHQLEVRLVDDDEVPQLGIIGGPLLFRARGKGHLARSTFLIGFGPRVVTVPDLGDYYFRFRIDGVDVGEARVSLLEPAGRA